ncbi:hypothetical protein ACJZTR_03850 [Neorickettsia risticii]|uniref:Uncharacterized protein n=1 Tax=Neorickettsia risticii (strain Illinois) TaxID=434131 RepID=C6V638_NEORI|nr:hypothetical protein [Neorickettsia risticii]ACT69847.1 conserved hypothetical protein [Neorickettsia risticii str. Illinois]
MLLSFFLVPLVYASFAGVVAFAIAPLQYLKIIRQETAASYSSIFFRAFGKSGAIGIFFGGALPYVTMNFLANLSFGLSDRISEIVLPVQYGILIGIFVRAFLGGAIETVLTIYPEVREIVRNKGDLAFGKGRALSILFPAFLRNSVAWLGATSSYEISTKLCLSMDTSLILSVILGLVFGIISIPLDVMVTQSCAAKEELTLIRRMLLVATDSSSKFLLGSTIRILQISIYTTVTVLTTFILRYFGI